MHYVKHFDILGVDTRQVACIELQGVPTAATEGAVGVLGINMASGSYEVYICTAVNGSIYTWQCLKDGKDGTCVAKAEINSLGELLFFLSDGKEINVGVVKGEQGVPGKDGENGVDGKDGENGADGVSIVKAEINADYELIFTLSNDTIINVGAMPTSPRCVDIDTKQIITGTKTFEGYSLVSMALTNKSGRPYVYYNETYQGDIVMFGTSDAKLLLRGESNRPTYNDYELDLVIETWESSDGLTRYRKWASGWLEQWGQIEVPSSNTITPYTLPLPFKDINYSVVISCTIPASSSGSYAVVGDCSVIDKTETGFGVRGYNGPKSYYACGFLGEE